MWDVTILAWMRDSLSAHSPRVDTHECTVSLCASGHAVEQVEAGPLKCGDGGVRGGTCTRIVHSLCIFVFPLAPGTCVAFIVAKKGS